MLSIEGNLRGMSMVRMLVVFALSLFYAHSIATAYGGQWEFFYANKEVIYYYDSKSITNEPKSSVSVWIKEIPTKQLARKYERTYQLKKEPYNLFLQALINCDEKRYAIKQRIFFDQNDTIISSFNYTNKLEWEAIPSGTSLKVLHEKICD